MKKLIYGSVLIAFILSGAVSCNKNPIGKGTQATQSVESINKTIKQRDSTDNYEKANNGDGRFTIIRCDRGRKKYGCTGSHWGLCNCKWFPDVPRKSGNTMDDKDGLKYEKLSASFYSKSSTMDISSENFVKNGYDTMFVDENIILSSQVAKQLGVSSITINKGAYTRISPNTVRVNVSYKK